MRDLMRRVVQLQGRTGLRYVLGPEPIARGGQGSVWPGTRENDGFGVAIKVALPSAEARRALQAEAALLHRLKEVPGVAEYLDELVWDDCPALVMPRYPLHADAFVTRLVSAGGPKALPLVLRFAAQIAGHLGRLHTVDVALDGQPGHLVHRDVKPENILVDREGGVRLADLGGTLVVRTAEPVRRAIFGSPLWAPYDQILPGVAEANPTWDTYALSVVVFWWITGTRPAYQSDPSPMLTPTGVAIWRELTGLAEALAGGNALGVREGHLRLDLARGQFRDSDVVDVRGRGAIQPADVQAIAAGVARLAGRDLYGTHAIDAAVDAIVAILSRGLSPLSHPSPPNRFWDSHELCKKLEAIATALDRARQEREAKRGLVDRVTRLEGTARPPTAIEIEDAYVPPPPRPSAVWGILLGILVCALLAAPLVLALYGSR
jgi:serine/threonine protein kinase